MFWDGKAYLRPPCHFTFGASHPEAFLSERSTLGYWGTFNVLLLTNKSTTEVSHHMNSLWQPRVPRLHNIASYPLDRVSALIFAAPWSYIGQTVTPYLWHLSKIFSQDHSISCKVCCFPSTYDTVVVLSIWKENIFP